MNSRDPGTLAVERVKFFGRHRGEVNSSAFSPNGQKLLTAAEDGCVYGWDTQSGRLLWRHRWGPVRFCRFSPHGCLFASTSCDCTIRLWDVAEAKCLQVLQGHQRSVETISFSPDAKQLASGGWDKREPGTQPLGSFLQSGQVLRHLVGHGDSVPSSDFTPSSDCSATGSWDSTIRMWDVRAGTPVIFHQELEGHSGNVSCLCYSASGLLASGSWDKTIHTWKPSTGSLLVQLKGHITWVKSRAFSPDGLQLASTGYSYMLKVWDCNTGKCIETLKGVLDVAHACVFTPDGKLLVSGAAA
uniref:WD repeat domain 38 n=1 Tax=Balaenoptera musculus TaxID=9771 RepID=A0A8C0HUH1_BALMU